MSGFSVYGGDGASGLEEIVPYRPARLLLFLVFLCSLFLLAGCVPVHTVEVVNSHPDPVKVSVQYNDSHSGSQRDATLLTVAAYSTSRRFEILRGTRSCQFLFRDLSGRWLNAMAWNGYEGGNPIIVEIGPAGARIQHPPEIL